MVMSPEEKLHELIGDGEAAAARLPALRPNCARFVVLVPIPDEQQWWLHRYEWAERLLETQVSKASLQDYERKIFDNADEAVATGLEWLKGDAQFEHVIMAENPYP